MRQWQRRGLVLLLAAYVFLLLFPFYRDDPTDAKDFSVFGHEVPFRSPAFAIAVGAAVASAGWWWTRAGR